MNMKRPVLLALFLSLLFTAGGVTHYFTATKVPPPTDYTALWKKVTSLDSAGLPESAMKETANILSLAVKEKNTIQQTKAHIYKAYFLQKLNDKDEDILAGLDELNKAARTMPFPENTLLYSVTAEYYQAYFESHRYTIDERTESDEVQENLLTWDTRDFLDTIEHLHMRAMANAQALQKIPVRKYADLLITANRSDSIRPTLYDLLAHRAIDSYMHRQRGEFTGAVESSMFLPPAEFVDKQPGNDPSTSGRKVAALYAALTRMHLNDANQLPLLYLDLERYRFAAENYTGGDKDLLYPQSLRYSLKVYGNLPEASLFGATLCEYIYEQHAALQQQEQNRWQALHISRDIQQRYPGTSGARQCASIESQILRPTLEASIPETTTYPGKSAVLIINAKQLPQVKVRIIQLRQDTLNNWRNQFDAYELYEKLKSYAATYTMDVQTASTPLYYERNTFVLLPALAHGEYVVCISGKDSLVAYTPLQVSSLELDRIVEPSGYQFQVKDKLSGKPVKDVTVTLYQQNYNYESRSYTKIQVGEGKTNAQGFTRTDLPQGMQGMQLHYALTYMGKTDVTGSFYNYSNQRVSGDEWNETYNIFTDRSIYRPGQTIYFKAICSETHIETKESRPLKNDEFTIKLNGPDGRTIKTFDLESNEFGSVQGSIVLPLVGQTGGYTLYCEDKATYIRVEEYKRPRFEITFDTLKTAYRLNDSIILKGYAKALSGESLSDAQVSVNVTRSAYYPFYRWSSWYPHADNADIPVNFTATTGNDGSFRLAFKAVPGEVDLRKTKPVYQFHISATVTDISGETHDASSVVSVGVNDFTLDIAAPGTVFNTDTIDIKASSYNLNGIEIPLKGTLRIAPVSITPGRTLEQAIGQDISPKDSLTFTMEEALRVIPGNLVSRIDTVIQAAVYTREFTGTTNNHIAAGGANKWENGLYRITLESRDQQGDLVSTEYYFNLLNPESKKAVGSELFMATAISKLQPGKKGSALKAYVSSVLPGLYVNYRVADKNKTYIDKALTLNKEARLLEIDLPAGTIAPVTMIIYGSYQGEHFSQTLFFSKNTNRVPLDIRWETFRNKLEPGQKETWRLVIANSDSSINAAELMAGMYDASLDQIYKGQGWDIPLTSLPYEDVSLRVDRLTNAVRPYFNHISFLTGLTYSWSTQEFDKLITLVNSGFEGRWNFGDGFAAGNYRAVQSYSVDGARVAESPALEAVMVNKAATRNVSAVYNDETAKVPAPEVAAVTPRRNLQETAFFFPQLRTNSKGQIVLEFTIPEALTRWRFRALAHNRRMEQGYLESDITTSKTLMVQPNMPRFLREGDQITLSARVTNTGKELEEGQFGLVLTDAYTQKRIEDIYIDISLKPGESMPVHWPFTVPSGVQMITWKAVASSKKHSDGEENVVPVLSNRVLVTEALPMTVRGNKDFTFTSLLNSGASKTLRHERLTVEFSSNPAWYAVLSLPYMIDYPHECAEQLFHRFYANTIAMNLANTDPRIRQVYDSWKSLGKGDQLRSNLEKNTELKQLLLEETPWVLEGNNETERMQRLGELFDRNMLENSLRAAENKLHAMQLASGAFPWFNGMTEDRYITSLIVAGYGRLKVMDASMKQGYNIPDWISEEAAGYILSRLADDYRMLKRNKTDLKIYTPSQQQLHDLYALSFYLAINRNISGDEAYRYFIERTAAAGNTENRYSQAMRALILHRNGQTPVAQSILKSMKENALKTEEMGMYWKNVVRGWYWYQAPVETQALCIEAFDEVAQDKAAVEEMKLWLLKQKQTQNWESTIATADACYALLKKGTDLLAASKPVTIYLDGKAVSFSQQPMAGTGYVKESFSSTAVKPAMGKIRVEKSEPGIAWGAVYWQYTEQMDKVKNSTAGLRIQKKLFKQERDASGKEHLSAVDGNTPLAKGDKVTVRLIISSDRNMEYVALKDLRASGLEPAEALSGYKYREGLGYYESIRDASTSFFFGYVPKGTYVLEYTLVVNNAGLMQSGTASIECMYAPEFRAAASGPLLKIH